MNQMIEDLLNLSRLTQSPLRRERCNLSMLVQEVSRELKENEPGRQVTFVIEEGVIVEGDPKLLRIVVENLLGNSWKYTSKHSQARIEFGVVQQQGKPAYFIRDDGAGFDPSYASRLFGAFQRLHAEKDFPGTGVGLAPGRRVLQRHSGRIWAEGAVERGSTFYFTLGL